MHDILPPESEIWENVEKILRETVELYGFKEIKTPIVEEKSLFERSVGESSDIVMKEMYTFTDKKGRFLALRPEGTASVVRAYIEGQIYNKERISRFYYFGPMFRYDRPQKGRYRQFYQFGIELLGGAHPFFDGEVIKILDNLFKNLGIENFYFSVNSLGCNTCKKKYTEIVRNYFEKLKKDLCEDCKIRLEKSPLRILDCKNEKCKEMIKNVSSPVENLCDECKAHFEKVNEYMKEFEIRYFLNPMLVRGLDYYTKTVFEVFIDNEPNAIAAGGRYDNLVKELGGPDIPATGFAIGIERIIPLVKVKIDKIIIYGIFLGEKAKIYGTKIADILRKENISVEVDYEERSLKSHLKIADRLKRKWCIIIGDIEVEKKEIILKNMETGKQENIKEENLVSKIKECLK